MADLNMKQQELVQAMVAQAQERFPEMTTAFEVRRNPENSEHIFVTVYVPFFDNERELEFWQYTSELECETHLSTGWQISLMPHYVAALVEV
jgi:hypothetical protein